MSQEMLMQQIQDWAEEMDAEAIIEVLPRIEKREDHVQAVLWIAYAYLGMGSEECEPECFSEAIQWLFKIEEEGKHLGVWNYRMSVAATWLLSPVDAMTYAKNAVEVEPDYPWGWLQYGKVLYGDGKKEEALKAAREGLRLVPGDGEFELLAEQIEGNVPFEEIVASNFPDFMEYLKESETPQMVKLYKKDEDGLHYAECWNDDDVATVHTGKVGSRGRSKEVKYDDWAAFMEEFIGRYEKQGYHAWSEDEEVWIVAQFPMKKFEPGKKELALRDRAESVLNEGLGWLGLGHVDGWEMGRTFASENSFVLNIYGVVVDRELGIKTIKEELQRNLDCSRLKIAVRDAGAEDYTLVYSANKDDQSFFL